MLWPPFVCKPLPASAVQQLQSAADGCARHGGMLLVTRGYAD
jgi:hypothetical protein